MYNAAHSPTDNSKRLILEFGYQRSVLNRTAVHFDFSAVLQLLSEPENGRRKNTTRALTAAAVGSLLRWLLHDVEGKMPESANSYSLHLGPF